MSIASDIQPLVSAVSADLDSNWDFDRSMELERARALSYGRLLFAIHESDQKVLDWLTYFVARRALSCWEHSCEGTRPRRVVGQIGRHLADGSLVDWRDAARATPSPYGDCRFSDTQCASDAVAECARYISKRDPIDSVCCVSSADVAYAHVLTDHRFREWLVEVALPIAWEKREMIVAEREALRPGEGHSPW